MRSPSFTPGSSGRHPDAPEKWVILAVEDDLDDAALIQAAFAYRAPACAVHIAGDAREAQDYLLGRFPFTRRSRHPLPDVIILDIGLPGMHGVDFLKWLYRTGGPWRRVPVVVFTANEDPDVAKQARALGAAAVMTKSVRFDQLVDLVREVMRLRGSTSLPQDPPSASSGPSDAN